MHHIRRSLTLIALTFALLVGAGGGAMAAPADGDGKASRLPQVFFMDGGENRFEFAHLLGSGYLGVNLTGLTPELRSHFGAPEDAGLLISRVAEESPAANSGLLVGDVLVSIDSEPVRSIFEVQRAIRKLDPETPVRLEVIRDGRALELEAEVGERQRPTFDVGKLYEWRSGDGEGNLELSFGDGANVFHSVQPEMFQALGKHLETLDWKELAKNYSFDDEKLQERIQELERRLEELAKALESSKER